MPIVIRKPGAPPRTVETPPPTPPEPPPAIKRRLLLEDKGPPCRVLVERARASDGLSRVAQHELLQQVADKLEWLAKGYGLWGIPEQPNKED